MTDRATKPLTSADLPALSVYVLTRFDDLTQTDDPTEVREVFEDFIAFAPDLARVAIDLTATVKRMEALADKLEREAEKEREKPNRDPHDYGWDDACTVAAHRIRSELNGDAA